MARPHGSPRDCPPRSAGIASSSYSARAAWAPSTWQDTQLDRPVALKVPHFEAGDGPQVLERFFREARTAATLEHANICPLHDVGEIDGTPYLTMAYIEGKSLREFAASRPLTSRQAALIVRKLALALQEAHKRGVIHRDLKPDNVMIDRRGEPVIMDFGLARRTRGQEPG